MPHLPQGLMQHAHFVTVYIPPTLYPNSLNTPAIAPATTVFPTSVSVAVMKKTTHYSPSVTSEIALYKMRNISSISSKVEASGGINTIVLPSGRKIIPSSLERLHT